MSFAIKPTNCKRCGKSLSMFEGRYCLECQKEIDKELEIYEGNTGVFDEPYPWRPDEIIGILKHIIEVADTNSCGVKEIDGIDEEAINNAITIIGSFEQIKWERDTAIAQLKELGYEFGEKIRTDDDCISRQAVDEIKELMTDVNGDTVYAVKMSEIRQLSSVNPQEPKTGKWQQDLDGTYLCSECGSGFKEQPTLMGKPMFLWCPLCGVRMEREDDNT